MPVKSNLDRPERAAIVKRGVNAYMLSITDESMVLPKDVTRNIHGDDTVKPVRHHDDRLLVGFVVDTNHEEPYALVVIWDPVTDDIELMPYDDL